MTGPKRIFCLCALSALILATTAFAGDVAAPKDNPGVSSPQATVEAPAPQAQEPQQGINFGDLFTPQPINRSCTANTDCHLVGGSPIMCTGVSTCWWTATFVLCDGTNETTCTCNPNNLPSCADPTDFCACYNMSPEHNYLSCHQTYC